MKRIALGLTSTHQDKKMCFAWQVTEESSTNNIMSCRGGEDVPKLETICDNGKEVRRSVTFCEKGSGEGFGISVESFIDGP